MMSMAVNLNGITVGSPEVKIKEVFGIHCHDLHYLWYEKLTKTVFHDLDKPNLNIYVEKPTKSKQCQVAIIFKCYFSDIV